MKMVVAIIRPERLEAVQKALNEHDVYLMTVSDVRAAVAWYGRVLGIVEHVRIGEGHRAQIGFVGSPAEIVVAEVRPGRRAPTELRSHQVMLKVEDANAVVARATAPAVVVSLSWVT